MASTGKTTNYELSQFIGTDKPSWLGDYNGDMLKIDTALGSINATATTAQSGVASAQSAASAAQQTANAAQQTATANAQDIKELKADLTNSVFNVTPTSTFSGGGIVSKNNTCVSVRYSILPGSKPSLTMVPSQTFGRIPIFSVNGQNIFNLPVQTITDLNLLSVTYGTTYAITSSTDNYVYTADVVAYYDGANTIFCGNFEQSIYNTFTNISLFTGTATILPTGNIIGF